MDNVFFTNTQFSLFLTVERSESYMKAVHNANGSERTIIFTWRIFSLVSNHFCPKLTKCRRLKLIQWLVVTSMLCLSFINKDYLLFLWPKITLMSENFANQAIREISRVLMEFNLANQQDQFIPRESIFVKLHFPRQKNTGKISLNHVFTLFCWKKYEENWEAGFSLELNSRIGRKM